MKKVRMPNLAGHLNLPFQKNGADKNRFNIQPTISKKHFRKIIPLMESIIGQIEEQQTLMAEMILEMQNRDTQLSLMQEQNQKLQKLNSELSELLNILPNTEELLFKMEEQKTKIELLENENQQWQKLAQKLNSENSLLLKQNTELLNWNSR